MFVYPESKDGKNLAMTSHRSGRLESCTWRIALEVTYPKGPTIFCGNFLSVTL